MTARRLPLLALVVATAGCAWLPDPASEQADAIEALWWPYLLVAAAVTVLVLGLLVVVLVRDRRRPDVDDLPSQSAHNIPVEVAYLLLPAIALGFLLTGAVRTQADVEDLDPDPDVVVDVVGYRWQWQFTYEGEDVEVSGADGTPPTLVLPAPAVVEFHGTSSDIIHSFWVPDFLFKRDLVPGRETVFQVATTTAGEHLGACAEFCGVDHTRMTFDVRTVTPEEFDAWLDDQRGADT